MSDFNLQAKGLFGRYCRIEMFRYGVPNEFYIHKIVSQNRTNTYCDVPLRWDSKPETHPAKEGVQFPDNLEEVIWVVQCGIDETKVFPVALKDVELLGEDFNTDCEFHKVGRDGYPFCASSTEIMRLRDENAKLRESVRRLMTQRDERLARAEAENAKLRELLAQRTAKRVIVSNADTDHATGHCACGACGGAIDPWDKWCRHCGAELEEDE